MVKRLLFKFFEKNFNLVEIGESYKFNVRTVREKKMLYILPIKIEKNVFDIIN